MSSQYHTDVVRQTVEAVYRAALAEVERLRPLGLNFFVRNKEMTAYEAKLHLRMVRHLQAKAMREEGKTLAQIGLLFGVSPQRVDQILKPPAEYKRPGRPRRDPTATNSEREQTRPVALAAYGYRLQVQDKFTYLDDVFEVGLLVNSLLHGSKQRRNSTANDSNPFAGPVSLSDIAITLAPIERPAAERVWYSSEKASLAQQ